MTDNPFPQSCAERFQAVKLLGTGGFGAVWLAEQKDLGRLVAVKTSLSSQIPDQEHIQRFIQEARATSRLEHPNIVRLIDYGVEGHRPWLVYEYIEGQAVADYMRKHPLSWQDAVRLVRDAALGLDYAHDRGIIHRDIKPDNLLLDRSGSLKIIDFGIAKWNSRQGFQTEAGLVLGTIEYMSPDQLRGKESSPQFDLYSLGVTFFQLLTGRLPFVHESKQEVVRMHLKVLAPAPSSIVPGIPAALDRIVSTCLAKTEGSRYPGMKELIEELEGLEVSAASNPSATIDLSISKALPKLSTRTVTRTSVSTAKVTPVELAPRGTSAMTIAAICVPCLVVGALGAWWVLRDDGFRAEPPPPVSSPSAPHGRRDPGLRAEMNALHDWSDQHALSIKGSRDSEVHVEELMVVKSLDKVLAFYSKIRDQIERFRQVRERLDELDPDDPWWIEFQDMIWALESCLGELKSTARKSPTVRNMHGDMLFRLRGLVDGDPGPKGTLRRLCLESLRIRVLDHERAVLAELRDHAPGWPKVSGSAASASVHGELMEKIGAMQAGSGGQDPTEWDLHHYRSRFLRLYLADAYAADDMIGGKMAGSWVPAPDYVRLCKELLAMGVPFARNPASWTGPDRQFAELLMNVDRGLDQAMRARWSSEHRAFLDEVGSYLEKVQILADKAPPVGRAGTSLDPFLPGIHRSLSSFWENYKQARERLGG